MHIALIKIENFRAIEDIEVTLRKTCNVIVGPNAMGKTTILEALRLAKALNAPRTQNETGQILNALGITGPNTTHRAAISAVAADSKKDVKIKCVYQLSDREIELLSDDPAVSEIATQMLLNQMGKQFANQSDLIGILSTPPGQVQHQAMTQTVSAFISEIKNHKRECVIGVTMNPLNGKITLTDPVSGMLVGYLDRRLPPYQTVFSYFPADRAIPYQDQPIQIGIHDAANQMESHNSQPQLKYQRLKNTIFGAVIAGRGKEQEHQFQAIFSRILRGKSLDKVGVGDSGGLQILIQDNENKKVFSLDGMSSGEKGLVLTFLLIAQSLEKGGIVLLDEPELHLNPAVCREVLSFLIEQYALPEELQIILCSHSPEILSVAFERDDCELLHLISGSLLTPVRRQDLEEVEGALRKLGATPIESLLFKGTLFVEGNNDSDVLLEGFGKLFQRYRVRDLGGRKNIEQEIQILQEQEKEGKQVATALFILDNDGQPTALKSTAKIKVLQWGRRCLENYLLDINILTDLVKNDALASNPITNIAALEQTLRRLAYNQIEEISIRHIYEELKLPNTSLTNKEIKGKSTDQFANLLFERMQSVQIKLASLDKTTWKDEFISKCEQRKKELESRWQTAWPIECDGKRVLRDFHLEAKISENLVRFKVRIMQSMASARSENWLTLQSLLLGLMADSE
jgi:predicted ATPase